MNEHEVKRAAIRLIQKYGKKALPKAVAVSRYYLGERDEDNAKRWVYIGMEVRKMQQVESIKDILDAEKEFV